jgi:hypothetical protein
MTIEFSLRRRANQSRWIAIAWLSLATIILIGSYVSLPIIAGKTLISINQIESSSVIVDGASADVEKASFIHLHIFALIILILCLAVISFASYLLARTAFIELDSAARFSGLADAICIAGDDFDRLEIAATLFVPRTKSFPEISEKSLKAFLETVKNTRG